MNAENRIAELNLQLPPAPKPAGVYRPVLVIGDMAFVSGHGPLRADGTMTTGRLGENLQIEEGKAAARQTGLAILASLRETLGDLGRIRRLVKLLGLVNATPDFKDHPAVINGCSELFAEVFGPENGIGTRSAFGAVSLPGGIAVEIEALFQIDD